MGEVFNLYCDESCHLENDGQRVMVVGLLRCPKAHVADVSQKMQAIKVRHGVPAHQEIKWTKVTPQKIGLYLDLIDLFFDSPGLGFRAVVVNKEMLRHDAFDQTHDKFYYKMDFQLLSHIILPNNEYHIYLDIKDSKGQERVKILHEILCNSRYDFNKQIIKKIQLVRSHEVAPLQLADLMIGALSYFHRGLTSSDAKISIIDKIIHRSGYQLRNSTLPTEQKFNLFLWRGRERM